MFYWRLLERYSPRDSFGPDKAFNNFLDSLGKITLVPNFLPALYKYELNNLRFIKFIWLLFAPEGYDFMDSGRWAGWPFPMHDPARFHPNSLSAWKISCILDFIEEFSDKKYHDNNRHRKMCLDAYLQLAFALFPYIELIGEEKERGKLLQRAVLFLSDNFSFAGAAEGYDSKRELETAMRFLLCNKILTDETKLLFLERVAEKNINYILSTNGPWSQNNGWEFEPIHIYADLIDDMLRRKGDFPYSNRVFSHQVAFIMEKVRQYYNGGGYFSENTFGKVFSLLDKNQGEEFAKFIMEISDSATVVTTYAQKKQMLLLIERIPPENDELARKARRKIRRFDANKKENAKEKLRKKALIQAMCQ